MTDFKKDMKRIQELVGEAFTATGALVALADGGTMNGVKLQKTLELTAGEFEQAALELRTLCERHSPGVGGYGRRPELPALHVTGRVERLGCNWLHITLNTLLPHCRFQPPAGLRTPSAGCWTNMNTGKRSPPIGDPPCWSLRSIAKRRGGGFMTRTTRAIRLSPTPSRAALSPTTTNSP